MAAIEIKQPPLNPRGWPASLDVSEELFVSAHPTAIEAVHEKAINQNLNKAQTPLLFMTLHEREDGK
jgi:hypothetical protein